MTYNVSSGTLNSTIPTSENHQLLILLCITSSLESTSCLILSALRKTRPAHDVTLSNSPPTAHHSHPPSYIQHFIPGSKLNFSTNLFHHSLLDCLLGLYWTWNFSAQRFFIFSYFSFFFFMRRAVDWAGWTASFRAHINIESSHHITSHNKR